MGDAGDAGDGAAPRHLRWDAEGLWQRLHPLLPGLSVEVVARTDSTNTRLLERARHGAALDAVARSRPMPLDTPDDADWPAGAGEAGEAGERRATDTQAARAHGRRAADTQPCLLVAEHQTRGRGRLGRDWQASPGASLTFSLAMPFTPAAGWSGLSLAVGLALADALDPTPAPAAPRLRLKWPNDLWLVDATPGGGRKLGGILVETLALPGHRGGTPATRWVVVGIGLNIQPQPMVPATDLASGYACLQELDAAWTAPRALHTLAAPLLHALLAFQQQGFAPQAQAYARRDLLAGQRVHTTLADCPHGLALGVDGDGALRLQSTGPDGQLYEHRVLSGEVSVRTQSVVNDATGGGATPC